MRHDLRTTCNRDCPDSCGIIATVEDGRVVAHRGDPAHGVTQGFLCTRGKRYLDRMYHPDRILHPLRRTAGGGWERVSWDAALDLVAERLRRARAEHGPLSVLAASYSGIHTWVGRVLWRLFWAHAGGATFVRGGLSVEAALAAQELDMGAAGTHEPEDLASSAGFAVWGKNLAVTRPHAIPFMKEARRRGAPLHVIDPVRTATARIADRWYALRPGTDGLLAMGVGRLLVERGAIDERFVREHTNGFEAWRRLVLSRSISEVAAACDLTPSDVEALAELYATVKPLATMSGLGPAYWENGGAQVRLIDALAAVTGNIGVQGGGAGTDIDASPGLDLGVLAEAPKAAARRTVLLPRLGEELLAAKDPPITVGFVAGANPAATAPATARVLEGLRALDFLVVVEQFHTATTSAAHLVLPCTTYLEARDLVTAYGHNWVGLTQEVVPPLGEAKPDGEILQLLAARLGFGAALDGTAEAWIDRLMRPWAAAGLTQAALAQGPRRRPGAVAVPFADGRFATPSGRFELAGELGPVRAPPGDGELLLVATKTLHMVNAQANPEALPEEPVARLHPSTVARLGLAAGGLAWVASAAGRLRARVEADEAVRRDVLLLNPSRWRGSLESVNQLREARLTDIGDGAAMHATRVQVSAA